MSDNYHTSPPFKGAWFVHVALRAVQAAMPLFVGGAYIIKLINEKKNHGTLDTKLLYAISVAGLSFISAAVFGSVQKALRLFHVVWDAGVV